MYTALRLIQKEIEQSHWWGELKHRHLVLMLNKRKIYFVFVLMYQNVKNTWGYLISMTYRRRNCEKSSPFKSSWLSWICFPHNLFTFSWTQRGARSEGWFTCSGRGLSRRRITLASPRTPIWPFGSVAMLYPCDKATTESLLQESMAPGECLMARQVWWQPAGEKGRSGRRNLILSAHTWADEDDGDAFPFKDWEPLPYHQKGVWVNVSLAYIFTSMSILGDPKCSYYLLRDTSSMGIKTT